MSAEVSKDRRNAQAQISRIRIFAILHIASRKKIFEAILQHPIAKVPKKHIKVSLL